jgi:peptide/nickel transport system permease protein
VAKLSVSTLALIVLMALVAPLLARYDPQRIELGWLDSPPSHLHPLGTDRLGRDVLSRLLYGARISLSVGLLVATLSCGIGALVGALAGYSAGWIDGLLMRFVDLMLALPTFFLLVAAQVLFPPRLFTVALIIAATRWMALARLVRGQLLSLKERDFVQAAQAIGCPRWRIIFHHLLPNTSGSIVVFFTLAVADAILIESALSFLGLGLPPDQASWGAMLADGRASLTAGNWWATFFPGLMILLVTLSVNLLGDELQGKRGETKGGIS